MTNETIEGEIVSEKALSTKVEPQKKSFQNEFDVTELLGSVGTLEPTEAQIKILFDSVNDEDIMIRPDGLIYLDWTFYASRLSKAFPLKWSLIPQGMPMIRENLVVWGFWLIIDGHLVGFAIGEQKMASNQMSYTDCCEGAKSNALMRLCKGIGMSPQLWHKPFVDAWKKKYSETYTGTNGKQAWRKKAGYGGNFYESVEPDAEPVTKSPSVVEVDDASGNVKVIQNWAGKDVVAADKIGKLATTKKFLELFVTPFAGPGGDIVAKNKDFDNHLKQHFKVQNAADLTWEMAIALHNHLYKGLMTPPYYGTEKKPEPQMISGWDASNAMAVAFAEKGLDKLYAQMREYVSISLGSVSGKKYLEVCTSILNAFGSAYTNPPTSEAVEEIMALLKKEIVDATTSNSGTVDSASF